MKPADCASCPYNIDAILVRYRRLSFVRIGDKKVILELVSDMDPAAKRPVQDTSAAACLERVFNLPGENRR